MDSIEIVEKRGANYQLLEITGTINAYTYAEFQDKVYNFIQQNNLVLDLSQVQSLSSSGLGVLMAALNDGEQYGNKLYLMKPSEKVRLAIESTGFANMFPKINSVTEII